MTDKIFRWIGLISTIGLGSLLIMGFPGSQIMANHVENLSPDFIKGVDISMLYEIEANGGKFYDNGIEKDALQILKDYGVNWIRVRIWNDPTDENGKPLGGGNCDYIKMTELARRAKTLGMKVLVDFHYSDWWADPGKQNKPDSWKNLEGASLATAVADFTYEVLKYMEDNDALPDMVQLGNEVNNGFLWPDGKIAGEGGFDSFVTLFNAGAQAVRKISKDTKIALHLAEGGNSDLFEWFLGNVTTRGIDFDVIGISYYPYWHGTLEELKSNLNNIEKYGKEIAIFETAYAWTLEDADGHPNIFGPDMEITGGYKATPRGQATAIREIMEAVAQVTSGRGLGIFYWEGCWIPVKGAGWKFGEGNPWENQALFDFKGHALPSLRVFNLIYEEDYIEPEFREIISPLNIKISLGESPALPEKIKILFSDDSIRSLPVKWEHIEEEFLTSPGEFQVKGVIEEPEIEVYANVVVAERENFILNPSFESGNFNPWIVEGNENAVKVVRASPPQNAKSGEYAVNYWLDSPFQFEMYQIVEGLKPGRYQVNFWIQGGGGENLVRFGVSNYGGEDKFIDIINTGWLNWSNPVIRDINVTTGQIKISVIVDGNAENWGWIDDFELKEE
ncbi:MAG TPA: glycosyl hydrolase 53 family protein [Candidatus Atribacteria bacterium]|nr:glycosyl hydrolase 53 family protein [Candidatus Atribacteria bacterium]